MSRALLLTLMTEDRLFTSSFDEAAQAVLWIGDSDAEDPSRALARVETGDSQIFVKPVNGCKLSTSQGEVVERAALAVGEETVFSIVSPRMAYPAVLYVRPSSVGGRTYRKLGFSYDVSLLIGRDEQAEISYRIGFVSSSHARLKLVGEQFSIEDLGSANGTFLNGVALPAGLETPLKAGDVLQILDLTIMIGGRFISLNEPQGLVLGSIPGAGFIEHEAFKALCPPASETEDSLELFYPAPRLMHSVHRAAFNIDDPPTAKKPNEDPAIMQLGPSFIMGIASVFTITSAVSKLMGGSDLISTLPSLAMSVAMIVGMVIWPIISRRYNKKKDERDELRRESTYTDYLNGLEAKFNEEAETQASILRENRVSVQELLKRADELSPRLMNRSLLHEDFMDLRVGIGDVELDADFRWPQQRFSMDEDKLINKVTTLSENPPMVRDVPLVFDPAEQFVAGIIGARDEVWAFTRGLLVQICSLYSYQDVKLVLVADEAEEDEWGFARSLPHVFDDTGVARTIATNNDEMMELGMRLEQELEGRVSQHRQSISDYGVYYVVVCANKKLGERSDAITRISKLRGNVGFSIIYLGEEIKDLPRECGYVIDLSEDGLAGFGHGSQTLALSSKEETDARRARMFARSDVSGTMAAFDPDIELSVEEARRFALSLARVRLDMPSQHGQLPTSLGFLEMFEAGSVAHLNIGQRWAEHDASRTLQTPVGRDAQGDYAILNLHENVHGPHGLIAGTTGSGKSEFIITYILSLCVNYPPDQVAFVLIDYKGGGLAGAFDNERHRLPHLAGTITNLDGAAISRSLVSIKSELKRRQDLLNKARDITGEATVDIYKYISYYKQGVLTEPLPHLFIVADEFAELKAQEPEFMDELISAARIGRSLGVHLILATQKPSGVVNDQIWSNSRFKVCLKVADAADSKEMIQRPDAAEIKGPGRYYMLVGYNEYFTAGQAAYAGGSYSPTEQFEPACDDSVDLIDDLGSTISTLRPPSTAAKTGTSELNAVLGQIEETARLLGKEADRLWLDPLPSYIDLGELEQKYGRTADATGLSCVLGEVDDPENQKQFIYEIDFAKSGNVMLYGTQNSGVDSILSTLLYALAKDYGPRELSIYAIDLGAGTLGAFEKIPQCGGVVLSGDEERLENLFKLIEAEIPRRRKLFATAGGIEAYNQFVGADKKEPRIVVALSNLAAFNELYSKYEERFLAVTRDAPRYGIHFIVTASAANVPRIRLKANFGLDIVTSFNGPGDYNTVLGSMRGIVPPKQEKRGLIKIDKKIYEFQAASFARGTAGEAEALSSLGARIRCKTDAAAQPIPVLPAKVFPEIMGALGQGCVPVGFSKSDISPVSFSFSKSPFMLVSGNDVDAIGRYLRGVLAAFNAAGAEARSYRFIDPDGVMGARCSGDSNVIQDKADAAEFIDAMVSGEEHCDVVVFSSIVQTMANLPAKTSKGLQEFIAKEKCVGTTGIVAATELWRAKGLYQDWYKVLSAYGNGVWVGGGFSEQTVFKFPRSLPEYRVSVAVNDGFYAMRGTVDTVRLVESPDEPAVE